MLTQSDIKILKENFATKDDLQELKNELRSGGADVFGRQ